MKMLVIIYNDAVDEAMINAFKESGIHGYTKWKEALGEGTETEPKLGTHCWPGKNNVLTVVVEDKAALKISETIKKLKSEHPHGGIKTFILQVEETI